MPEPALIAILKGLTLFDLELTYCAVTGRYRGYVVVRAGTPEATPEILINRRTEEARQYLREASIESIVQALKQ